MSRIDYLYLNDGGYTLYGWYNEELPFDIRDYDFHLLDDENIIKISDFEIKAIHLPGHTLGGMAFIYEDVIFTGDTLFKMSIGRTDFKGGSLRDIYKSIIRLLKSNDDNIRLFPGHDDMTTVGFEKENNPYYHEALERVGE